MDRVIHEGLLRGYSIEDLVRILMIYFDVSQVEAQAAIVAASNSIKNERLNVQ